MSILARISLAIIWIFDCISFKLFFFYTLPPLWICPTCHSPSPDFASPLKNQAIWFTVGNVTAYPSCHSRLIMGETLMPSDSATIWGGEGGVASPALLQALQCHLVGGTIPYRIPGVHIGSQPPLLEKGVLERPFSSQLCWEHMESPQLLNRK